MKEIEAVMKKKKGKKLRRHKTEGHKKAEIIIPNSCSFFRKHLPNSLRYIKLNVGVGVIESTNREKASASIFREENT